MVLAGGKIRFFVHTSTGDTSRSPAQYPDPFCEYTVLINFVSEHPQGPTGEAGFTDADFVSTHTEPIKSPLVFRTA